MSNSPTTAADIQPGTTFRHRSHPDHVVLVRVQSKQDETHPSVIRLNTVTLEESAWGPIGTRLPLIYLRTHEITPEDVLVKARVTIDLTVGAVADHPRLKEALDSLADIMAVQAEDGLYTLGQEEADDFYEEGPGDAPGHEVTNEYVGPINSVDVKVEVL